MARPPTLFDTLRTRIRRFQLIVGLGFVSMFVGSLLSASLVNRVGMQLEQLPWVWLQYGVSELIVRFWVWGLLPVFCYGLGRALDLKPWSTPLGAALVGQGFLSALNAISDSSGEWYAWVSDAVTLAAGVVIAHQSLLAGRAAAAVAAERAKGVAEANQQRYAGFAEESARIAALKEGPAPAVAVPAAPAVPEAAAPLAPAAPAPTSVATEAPAPAPAVDAGKPPTV